MVDSVGKTRMLIITIYHMVDSINKAMLPCESHIKK